MNDLVSIITPNYNCAKYIAETIDSIQAQTYKHWELLIVDDCSTDEVEKVLESYLETDERIIYLENEYNLGAALSRNKALRKAKGRWIAFLDSDDLWEPTKLEKQIRFMEENGYSFSYTMYQEMDEEGEQTGVIVSGPSRISKGGMFAFCWPGCLTVMYDANQVGLLQIEDIKKNNDYAMWLKVCKKTDCHLLPEVLATYRRGRSGSISTQGVSTMIKWHFKLFREEERMSVLLSSIHTCINLICGLYKKIRYVHKK